MKNLENYGVLEMDAKETQVTDGGNPVTILRSLAYAASIFAAFDEWYQESGYIDNDMGMPFTA